MQASLSLGQSEMLKIMVVVDTAMDQEIAHLGFDTS